MRCVRAALLHRCLSLVSSTCEFPAVFPDNIVAPPLHSSASTEGVSEHKGEPVAKEDRGFASMDRARQREIASKGGKAAHQKGTAHEWTSEEAREAGRKGGMASHRRKQQQQQASPSDQEGSNHGGGEQMMGDEQMQ